MFFFFEDPTTSYLGMTSQKVRGAHQLNGRGSGEFDAELNAINVLLDNWESNLDYPSVAEYGYVFEFVFG